MKLQELIDSLEHGIDRAERDSWIAFSINADKEAEELLEELKRLKEAVEQAGQH